MNVKYTYIAAIFVGFACAGCGSTEVHQILLREPTMQSRGQIEVYVVGGTPPRRPFYEVAYVQAIGHGSDADVEDVTRALANRGARLGCDAIVRVHVELGTTRAHASGVCVSWLPVRVNAEPLPAPGAAPAPSPAPSAPAPEPTSAPASSDGTSI
ncbi:MAG: hypothetical protein ACRELY_26675 [Polyangiaceae bacterium]